METVKEIDSPKALPRSSKMSVLEEERLRMKMRLQQTAEVGAAPSSSVNRTRGVRRMHSANHPMRAGSLPLQGVQRNNSNLGLKNRLPERARSFRSSDLRPTAPTKSADLAASMRGNAVARANSSRGLLRHKSSGAVRPRMPPPMRGKSGSGLRPYSRDQIVNCQIEQRMSNMTLGLQRGPGGTLQRQISDMSFGTTGDDLSCVSFEETGSLLTMDSIHLRKEQQVIADPVDAGTYVGDDYSFADHETYVTRLSTDDLDLFESYYGEEALENQQDAVLTFAPNTFQLHDKTRGGGNLTDDEQSFCSRLTTDFTEFGEYEYEEDHSFQAE